MQRINSSISHIKLGFYELKIIHKTLGKNKNKINVHKLDSNLFTMIFNKKYVKYKIKEYPVLYTEIYIYLKYEELP